MWSESKERSIYAFDIKTSFNNLDYHPLKDEYPVSGDTVKG